MAVRGRGVGGLEKVMRELNKEIAKIHGRTREGLMAGGFIIQADSQKHTPRETGTLVNTAYTEPIQPNLVEIGYKSEYAPYVHENVEQKLKGQPRPSGLGKYWGPPPAEPKFLQNAAVRKRKAAVNAIARRAKIR